MVTIKVEHEVAYDPRRPRTCYTGDSDFWGDEMCPYLTFTHRGSRMKGNLEHDVPRCKLFKKWIDGRNKCDECWKKVNEYK